MAVTVGNRKQIQETGRKIGLKDPGSAVTHMIGVAASIIGVYPLLSYAYGSRGVYGMGAVALFLLGLILLYGASSTYHSLELSNRGNRILRKLDHSMIYVLIAGTYSPICMLVLTGTTGRVLLAVIWGMALLGILQAMCWITCPKWVSSVIYVAMGWVCIAVLPSLIKSMPVRAFTWLFVGGAFYTAGAVIYALKLPVFNRLHKNFGTHEIFHLFCLAGSLCHYIMIFHIL